MKKITLILLLLCFSFGLSAQVLNQSAAWPNTNWTVTGVFNTDPLAFEADPTLTSNFAFDDDDAGGASDDDIAAESPVIDLTAAFAAGETWLFLDVDFTYNDLGDVLNLEYWDADSSTWEVWQQFAATADQPTNDFCAGGRDSFTSNQLNIAGFSATQLSGFQYRIAFYDDGPGGGAGFEWGFCFDPPTVTSQTPPTCPDPDMLMVSNVLETSVDLGWNENGSATLWNIEWGAAGFTPGSGTLVSGLTTTTYTLTGLVAGTSYDFYVQSDCGGAEGTSNFIGPFNFVTAVPGGTCAAAFPMTVEADCGAATPTTFDFSIAEDIDANGENPSCDGFGNFGYWVSFTAPAVGSVVFNFGGAADNIGLEVLDACGGTAVSACSNNIFDTGDSSDIIGGLTPGDTYVAVIWRDTQAGTAEVCIEEGPSCTFPVNLDATNLSLDGADLSWTENGTATVWNVEVVLSGNAPTGVPTATGVTNPYTVTGLLANTDYDFYVQADCGGGDLSDFAGPFTFTTLCDVFVPDYLEDFTDIIPNCWDEASNGDATTGPTDFGAGDWIADEFLNIGANDGAYKINLFNAGTSDWIISPEFDLTGGPFQVEFDFAITNWNSSTVAGTLGSDDLVQLLITIDDGVSWIPLLTYDNTSVVPLPGIHPVVDLTAYSGETVQFGILGSEGTVSDAGVDVDVFVDNFQVRNVPTCPEPSDLTSTNLSLTSTEIGWTEAGTSTLWNIEYGVAGFTQGTGTVVTDVTTNPYIITGLTSDTAYEFYVQAICDPTNLSSWTGPGEFFTGYCASVPTSNDGEGVTNVTIGVTDFPSFGDVTYENQTSPVVNVFQGINTNVAVSFATGFTYGTNIWIDFNDDLVFDATELVFQGESTNANPTTLDASFTMPITAPLGEHRMRIGTADAGQATPNPCYNGTWGVTLDFTVNIQQLTCTLPEADFTVNTDCDNDQFFIDVDVTSLGDATSLEISNDFDATTVQATATGVVQAGPFPFGNTVKIFVTNEQDNNCVISSPFFEVLACPPLNDECDGAISAVVNEDGSCDMVTPGTILAATTSNVPAGSCTGDPDDDVWFEFTALNEVHIISLINIAGGTTNLDHAVYEGSCGTLTELYCSNDDASVTPQLVVGDTYLIRVFSGGSQSETSTFDLCIRNAPSNIICENAENFCSVGGALSTPNIIGIPDPNDLACLGTAPNPVWNIIQIGESGPIEIEIVQQDDNGNGLDVDFVIWGPFDSITQACTDIVYEDCPTCPFSNNPDTGFYPFGNIIDCSYSAASIENLSIDNAIAGEIYMLLVTNFNGNPGTITIEQTNIADTSSGEISAEIEAEIVSNEIFIDSSNDITETDEVALCGFDSVVIQTDSPFADEFVWFKNGFVVEGETGSTLTVTESDNYQVQAFDNQCGVDTFSQIVNINLYNEPAALDLQTIAVCDSETGLGEEFDLDEFTAELNIGDQFTVSYYTNTDDANQAINQLGSLYTTTGETLIIRIEDVNAVNDGFTGCRILSELDLVVGPEKCVFPQGISPGVSPGFNDSLDLSNFDVSKIEIFNRNGTLVYSKANYTDEWIGQTNSGEELPVGTYFYTITYADGTKTKNNWIYISR
ncbi:fibronectin type III domain-containing protein [Winogradskyella sp. PE311]|uniref:fibronectin type III domain-containing protein n=1 Tax=Winogradskyella sp. PE311 TaxID=3366943 RepID=UPI00397FACDE